MRLLLFALQFPLLDLALRGFQPYGEQPIAILVALGSMAFWASFPLIFKHRVARILTALFATIVLAGSIAFFTRYHIPFDGQAIPSLLRYWRDIVAALQPLLPVIVGGFTLLMGIQTMLLLNEETHPRLGIFSLAFGLSCFLFHGPSTLDQHLLAAPFEVHSPPQTAAVPAFHLPEIQTHRLPSVLLIVGESLRHDSYCSTPTIDCPTAPRINALFPARIGFEQARSVASFTVISMAAISTGSPQAISRQKLLSLPTLFELAHSARGPHGEHLTTAYWAGHAHPMFERESVRDGIDNYQTLEDLTGGPYWYEDVDEKLLSYFSKHFLDLPRPFFLVLQLAGTHAPYAVDQENAPFQPWTHEASWSTLDGLWNAYKNSIHKQDRLLADALEPLLHSGMLDDTVVLFTSDHGEEFGEHKQIHHGQDVLDTQTHIPFWIQPGRQTLSPKEIDSLLAHRNRFITHLDIFPTILDLWGIYRQFSLEWVTTKLPGRSLLRPLQPMSHPIPLANCTEAFPCPFRNAGVLLEDRKIEAQAWDPGWNCWQLGGAVEQPLPDEDLGCEELRAASRVWFPELPNRRPNL